MPGPVHPALSRRGQGRGCSLHLPEGLELGPGEGTGLQALVARESLNFVC